MKMRWYFFFFLASGFCSLVYEVVWLRLAMAEFGVTTPMVSIVLSMFMVGLGLGSWWSGSLVRRLRSTVATRALRLYALTELLIGISGLLVPHQLALGHALLRSLGKGVAWQSATYYLVAGAWVALTLVPWCVCMGATFPFVMAVIRVVQGTKSGRSFSYLYVANVLGALLGTLTSAFVLIELLGFRGTLHLASAVNGVLAASALALSRSLLIAASPAMPVREEKPHRKLYGLPESIPLWLLFLTGISSMAMEVVWIRQFTPYLGNVVYAFAMILAVYLVATLKGSRHYRAWVQSHEPRESVRWWIMLGAVSLVPLAFADPQLLPQGQGVFAVGVLRVMFGIVPFCHLAGFLTPMLVDYWSSGDPDRAGSAYAVNVAGCVVGPLLAGFWLLPRLGERRALIALSLPLFAFGALAAARGRHRDGDQAPSRLKTRLSYGLAALATLLLLTKTHDYEAEFRERVVRRDNTATVIATGEGFHKVLLVNGIGMTSLTPSTKFMAHLPLAFMRRRPKNGLVVCFGMGTTFRSMLSWGIQATAVDLVPSVPAMFSYFHPDAPALLRSPLARIVVDDGRRFLNGSTDSYDVITIDPPPPPGASTSSLLYSREFYAVVKNHLRPGGIAQVWFPAGLSDSGALAAVAKALDQSFPSVRAFPSNITSAFYFLASMEPIPMTPSSVLAARMPPSAAADFVEWGPRSTPEEQFNDVLGLERSVESLIAVDPRIPAVEDDQPINEYYYLREVFHYYR
ncbi:MAG TPA: fused MFS/spermidine synthase [Terriglobia bacterium]|nr:fused MFS/spermidine synthase [Terriglobia bacterium]